MTDNDILERIQKVYNSVMGTDKTILTPDTKIIKTKQVSSFVLMEFIMNIEEEFDIELSYLSIRSAKTVQDLIDIIKKISENSLSVDN